MAAEGGTTAMMNWTGTTATSSPAESPTSSTSSSFASSNGMNNLNDSHISDYTSALSAFLAAHPTYPRAQLDALRATDYARLDKTGHVYLDFTGGGLYAESQLKMHFDLLAKSVLGNPHSNNPTSAAATELVESARHAVLEFFEADPEEYTVVFTPNASGALKLVGESYPFGQGSRYLLTGDNHNSNNGERAMAGHLFPFFCKDLILIPSCLSSRHPRIRTIARGNRHLHRLGSPSHANPHLDRHRPTQLPLPKLPFTFRIPGAIKLFGSTTSVGMGRRRQSTRLGRPSRLRRIRTHQQTLFCRSQTRLCSVELLQDVWVSDGSGRVDCAESEFGEAQEAVVCRWDDYDCVGQRRRLGMSERQLGLKCRKARSDFLSSLCFAKSRIQSLASRLARLKHHLAPGEAGFEDGTVSYLSLPAISIGLSHLSSIGMDAIHSRVECLTSYLLSSMLSLKHANGSSMCKVFGPRDMEMRGGTVAFYVTDVDGVVFDVGEVERMAGEQVISLRTGW